jgi:hypothetical protein
MAKGSAGYNFVNGCQKGRSLRKYETAQQYGAFFQHFPIPDARRLAPQIELAFHTSDCRATFRLHFPSTENASMTLPGTPPAKP